MHLSSSAAEAIRTAKYSATLVGTPDMALGEQLIAAARRGVRTTVISTEPKVAGLDLAVEWLGSKKGSENEFLVVDGQMSPSQRDALRGLEEASPFNFGQYDAEHAALTADVMLLASAGTGKTEALASRVLFLLHHGVPAERICMLTFTREAATNMRGRIVAVLAKRHRASGNPIYLRWMCDVSHLHVSTIHSFAKTIIARFGPAAGIPAGVRIGSRKYERLKVIEQAVSELLPMGQTTNSTVGLRLYEVVAAVAQCLDTLSNRGVDLTETALDWGQSPIDSSLSLGTAVAVASRRMAQLKARDEVIDVGDLTLLARKAIRRLASANRPLVHFEHVLVDEFQDTDDGQIELLAALAKKGPRLFVVGDVKQSIYRFRGAEHTAFARLKTQLSGRSIESISLRKNYRSSAELLSAVRVVWQAFSARGLLDYEEPRDAVIPTKTIAGAAVSIERYSGHSDRDDVIRKLVVELLADAKGRSTAALVRTNGQAQEFKAICASVGVHCHIDTEGGLFDTAAARDLLVLTRVLMRTTDLRSVLEFVASPWAISACSLADLWYHRNQGDLEKFLLETAEKAVPQWPRLRELPRTLPVIQVIRECAEICRPDQRVGAGASSAEYLLSFDRILELCSEKFATDGLTLPLLESWLANAIAAQIDEPVPRAADAEQVPLHCLTVHKAKGLQYDTVLVPFVSKSFSGGRHEVLVSEPVKTVGWRLRTRNGPVVNSHYAELRQEERDEVRQDEARLMYVALTRAERRLALVLPSAVVADTWGDLLARS